jgi:hypothetical protein
MSEIFGAWRRGRWLQADPAVVEFSGMRADRTAKNPPDVEPLVLASWDLAKHPKR